ncbi:MULTISPECIES: hypothetical protein [unclassified Variovorax]|uniref:hypothetical protein n=1 Tax=unclassified Variovorax TaxID=663243 RepID=UPI000ADBB9E6|nr:MULTISPECIES: hypothetical protein [unclassified Variovorax]PNG56480.1 hypothetical protein CHC07_02897 [Variovorax sp. B4]PNG57903.1 hypothetical protein CHC06_02899 [Variovorax sp. B2]VTV09635.1 hypothetical protein WDL1CHR_00727 [Variovorax sp. WDL1]
MALEDMHDVLVDHLKAQGALQFAIDCWENLWWQAHNVPDAPLPCPNCFLEGRVERLVPLERTGALGAVRCDACKAEFEFPRG